MEEKIDFPKAKDELKKRLLCDLRYYLNDVRWLRTRAYTICKKGKEYDKLTLIEISLLTRLIDRMDDECRNIWGTVGEIELLFDEAKIRIPSLELSAEYREEIQKPLHLIDAMFDVMKCFNKFDKNAIYQFYQGVVTYGETKRVKKLLKKRIKYIEETPESCGHLAKENTVAE